MAGRRAKWEDLAARAATCTACELHRNATQTVFGAGAVDSPLVLVGEQPGDVEDREGEPFVGPAGHLLDRAMQEAGLPRERVYLTNAVKHFRWEPRGKRRIHKTPGAQHVRACHQWVDAELALVRPELVVLLGAVAAKALAPELRVARDRGVVHEREPGPVLVTVHPSAVLRSREQTAAMAALVDDLRVAANFVGW